MGIRHSSQHEGADDGDPAIRWSRRCDGGKRFAATDAEPTDAPGSGATPFEEALALEVLRASPGISHADLGARVRAFVEEVRKVTAEGTTPPRAADLAFGDGRESVWREINALLGEYRNVPPYSIPDRIRMLVADVKRLRAEIEKITRGQPEERSQLLARSRIYEQWAPTMRELLGLFGYCVHSDLPGLVEKLIHENNNASAKIARLEARDRESWEILKGYADAPGAWAGRVARYLSGEPPAPDPLLVEARALLSDEFDKSVSEYRSRRISLLTKLDARIGGGGVMTRVDERQRAIRQELRRHIRVSQAERAVIEAAVSYAEWCKANGPVTPEPEEQAVCAAVDALIDAQIGGG